MLEQLRRSTSGILAKILIALLVLSFAVWGIADVFTGFSNTSVATVGDKEISVQEFERDYRREISDLSRQAGRTISSEQAKAIGIDRQVLSRIIGATAVEEHAQSLGLQLSDEALVKGLEKDPQFLDTSGKFSPIALKQSLAQIGLSQRGFLDLRRKDELRNQITSALLSATSVPDPLIDIVHEWRTQTRIVEFATIDADKAVTLPTPTEKDLKDTYEQNKQNYMVPELRQLAILTLSQDEFAKKVIIDEADIKASYERTKDSYDTPETRKIQQISFDDKAKAEAAKKAIDGGKDFVEVAKEAGANENDIELGVLTKKKMIDKKIADVAFALEKEKVSDVTQGTFTTVLLRVTEITPGILKTYDDVKSQVRDRLAQEQASIEIQKLFDKVDDGRAAGTPLKDIAKDLDLPFQDVAAVSSENKDADGKNVLDSQNSTVILNTGFEGQVGLESEPARLRDGGFAWVDVLDVTAPKQKNFDQVKNEVKAKWETDKRRAMLKELADKAVAKLKNGEDFAKVGEEIGGKVSKTPALTRTTIPQGLTQAAITQSFLLPVGGISSAATENDKSRSVFRVVEIKKAEKPSDENRKSLLTELQRDLQRDQLAEYVTAVQKAIGVEINEGQFQRATGGATQ
ncbi:MAG: SurA N-terminal domain-containing protein [Hyphomicrobiaceae bacterium]